MITRRTFCLGAASAGVVSTVLWKPAFAAGAERARAEIDLVLRDLRFPESGEFAQAMQRQGSQVHDVMHDMSKLWYDELLPRLEQGRRSVAGVTTAADFLVMRQLGAAQGLRLRHERHQDLRTARRANGDGNPGYLVSWLLA